MSFVEIAKRPPARSLCMIGSIVASLPEDEAEALRGMLAADLKVWPHRGADSIQQALKDEGYVIGEKTIRAHRFGECACSRANP